MPAALYNTRVRQSGAVLINALLITPCAKNGLRELGLCTARALLNKKPKYLL